MTVTNRPSMMRFAGAIFTILIQPALALAQGETIALPDVSVVAPSPAGGNIDREKVPGTVQTLTTDDFARAASPNVTQTLFQRIPGVSLSDPEGNSAAQELEYRGFAASPVQGTPQGLAVYLNGIRFNEAFGDTVNWDLIPTNAIERADVWTNNPVFGLNALGGAINLQMKSGYTYRGLEGAFQGGSFGRSSGAAQYGVRIGDDAAYIAAQGLHDNGWRFKSPADFARLFADFAWRRERAEIHLTAAAATSSLGVAAATPVPLLDEDDRAIYTTPQTTQNSMALLALHGNYSLSDAWSLQSNLYIRGFRQNHLDGNAADTERCSNNASPSFRNHLCLEDDGFPRPDPVTTAFRDQFAVLDQSNAPIPCPPGTSNTCDATPYGTIDRTATKAGTSGASLQATTTERLFDYGNHLVFGGSLDHSIANFTADSTLGFINPDLRVTVNPAIPGNGAVIHTLGGFGYGPVDTDARSTYYGLYALDTLDLTERLSATVGGRLNVASVTLRDQLGASPDLNSNQTYTHFNPISGLTYKLTPDLTAYGGYSQSNRAPTPLELACSNPVKPCLLENFLVSDPPLKQVVARTYEAGLRQNLPLGDGKLEWKIGLFRTESSDDIINLASVIQGRGFFQNIPGTRRQGVETGVQYSSARWLAYAGYSFTDATYQFTGDLPSPNNPMATADGNVHVVPGKRIPGIPQNQAKFGIDLRPTPQWTLGLDTVAVGSRYFIGDDANQNKKLAGYWLLNLHVFYQLTKNLQIFGLVNNLFNRKYALFGTYFDPQGVANAGLPIVLTDRRTEVLGPPLSIYGGIRVTF